MANKMLIDATHPEETRVVVVRGNRVEEFDFESASRRQLRGNIYLAKVTRVEPSLQAAFVDYGGNRHGFLAFSEIHPDYYQIPVADRQALIAEEQRAHRAAEEEADLRAAGRRAGPKTAQSRAAVQRSEPLFDEGGVQEQPEGEREDAAPWKEGEGPDEERAAEDTAATESMAPAAEPDAPEGAAQAERAAEGTAPEPGPEAAGNDTAPSEPPSGGDVWGATDVVDHGDADISITPSVSEPEEGDRIARDAHAEAPQIEEVETEEEETVESVGGSDALEEVQERRPRPRRQYKIQEVIKRRQVMLVQVVKEERGTKGAALTTYLSLAGRYSVLMPNTARGGGISRKITNPPDRKRLKQIAQELDVPEGMGVILRTAGANRTKAEVKRDFEYLLRVWESVRDLTLRSTAPKLVYEEGSLIKRAIRDLYNKDIDEIVVAGEEGYREAKEFMRMLMPSHAKNVKLYKDTQPIFTRNGVEAQLDAMFSPVVQLRSGGYIVLNQTEALVAIDVNSGRATREHHIEDTAYKTNLEAAEEIARQLRLRDLAGLIVIDFIDMDEKRNNRAVERKLKECLKNDRARIQVGRISHFGLLEMSRQRIRSSVLESSTDKCPHCGGTGLVRSLSSVSLQLLRAIEEMLLKGATHNVIVRTRPDIALYLLNQKRAHLRDLEMRFRISITAQADAAVNGQQPFLIERGEQVHSPEIARAIAFQPEAAAVAEPEEDEAEVEGSATSESPPGEPRTEARAGDEDEAPRRKRRRRRRGRRGEIREAGEAPRYGATEAHEPDSVDDDAEDAENDDEGPFASREGSEAEQRGDERRRKRRGRRGGRRNRRENGAERPHGEERSDAESISVLEDRPSDGEPDDFARAPQAAAPEPQASPPAAESPAPPSAEPSVAARAESVPPPKGEPAGSRRRSTVREPAPVLMEGTASPEPSQPEPRDATSPPAAAPETPTIEEPAEDSQRPRRTGWWARRVFGKG
ncbi:MAG TPA: Rne/Rng family ribonuclease [Xanthobacteraceae bacterium]|nr:Rne/Rng family ribonuclease [Xanthobacteraceae bacterium]